MYTEPEPDLVKVRVVDEIFPSRNSPNIYFVFREIILFISRNFVSRNITKFCEILRNFVTKLNFSQGKIHF
jgi:hypothetical protein